VASGSGELLLGDSTATGWELGRSLSPCDRPVVEGRGDLENEPLWSRSESVGQRSTCLRGVEPGTGSGDGGVPRVYKAVYSQTRDNFVQRWHGSVPEHRVFFLLDAISKLIPVQIPLYHMGHRIVDSILFA
jgi:hypothetical protein